MRTLILGAGALGGYFGARLLAAGRDVTFMVRPTRAALLAQHGLNVISPRGDLHLPPPATITVAGPVSPYDIVLLSAKAYDLPSAIDAIAPAVGATTAIIPLLNGMAHMQTLDQRFGAQRVFGGTSVISASLTAEGTIHHLNDRDVFLFGGRTSPPHPHLQQIEATLSNAGFPSALRPDIIQDMWDKWTFLATLAGITCLMRANIAEIHAAQATRFAVELHQECIAIAAAEGYAPAPPAIEQSRHVLSQPSPLHASMLRDLESGAPIESYQIIGDLLARGASHSLATPLLAIASAHLKAYEARRQRPA